MMTNLDPGHTSSSSQRPRVLLVDDNAAGRRALERALAVFGFEVTAKADGQTALEALREGPPPEFVLTDLLLPDLDGREIALVARQLVPRPFVALITGWNIEPEVEDPTRWGVDQVFLKPLRLDELMSRLAELSGRAGGPEPEGGGGPGADPTRDA